MPVVGVAGGIAAGKSSFCRSLHHVLGGQVFDADAVVRELVKEDAEVGALLREQFGAEIFRASGDLNRPLLRAIVFSDERKKRALEQILHPRIRHRWATESVRARGTPEFYLADIPLLYETAGESLCDLVVVVACSAELQLQRLIARSQLTKAAALQIIASQMPLLEKMKRADHVAWNNGGTALLQAQAETLAALWQQKHG